MGSSSADKSSDRVSAGTPGLDVVVRKLTSSPTPAASSGSAGDGKRGRGPLLRGVLPRGVKEIRGSGVCLMELGVSWLLLLRTLLCRLNVSLVS